MMKKHGLRRFFSLLLAVIMVCALLPTAALAEDTTGADETKTVVVDEKKPELPAPEQPKNEDPPAPEDPKTFTVTYTDGADGAVFPNQVYPDLSSGTPTPAFSGTLEWEGHTFAGWNPEVAETVTGNATYVAKWEAVKSAGAVHKAPPRPQSNSTVVLHPAVNSTVTGVKVSVGGTLSGYTIKSISGYDITVDLGKYNVNNDTFRLPYAKDIWYGVDDNKVDYISWAGGGSNRRSEGASALLVNGKNTAYYYFKGAPVLPTFTLNYNANGGTGAPTNQTYKATSQYEMSHEFTISSQKPTRENYTFLGWSTNRNATTAEYQPNGKIIVTSTTTLYAVWKEDAPTKPTAPDNGTVKNLLGNSAVKVHCSTPNSGHADVTYPLMDGSFTVGDVQGSNDNYTCVVTVQAAQYVTAYGNGHTLAGANESPKTITLKHNGTKWTVQSTTPIVFNVVCNTAPTTLDNDAVKNLLGENAVQIICTNTQIGHGSKTFGLIDGTFTVYHNKNNCEVVINYFSPYVDAFNAAVNVPAGTHITDNSMAGQNRTKINLVWSNGNWTAADAPAKCHVVCNLQPAEPTAPTEDWFINAYKTVTVNCTNTPAGHGSESYNLVRKSIAIGEPTYDSTSKIYSCVVTVTSTSYVAQFNGTKGTHTPETDTASRTVYSTDGKNWVAPSSNDGSLLNPIVFNVACTQVEPPQAPTAPSHDDLSRLIGDITVNCTNDAATHTTKSKGYALIDGSYTTDNVEGTPDTGYTLTVTVNAEKYVTQFDTDTNATHTPRDGSKVVTLKYENDAWTVKEGKPVSFDVACVALPTFDELKELFKQKIFVECNTKPAHTKTPYDLIAGSYTIEDFSTMRDFPTCTVVLNSRKYVESFNGTTNAVHTPENEVKRVGLILRDGRWGVAKDDVLPVVFRVSCVPDAPTDNYLKDLLHEKVKVACINGVHATLVCDLLDGSYRGSGVQPDGNGGYTYTVTIAAAEYVKKYNAVWPHSLVKDEPTEKSVTLVWDANDHEWGFADPNAVPVNFNVECLYTVTYEDGVNGSVFKTVSFPNLKKGEATPTIDDPIRVGYKFAGWEPTVAATVTKDVTYIAQWEKVDTTFTVKYNDNVKGKAFKEQVYEDLKYNEETPDFNGKPERSGYTFTGWKPVVADRVTKDVVYYAQWKSNSGKDRVPKTGDGQIVMILGSVLLFSFCGATAVCLNDRKRKQG